MSLIAMALRRLVKSKSFLPRVGRLAALHGTSTLHESLAQTTLTPREHSPSHSRSPRQRSGETNSQAATQKNLLQAIDLLKPLLENDDRRSRSPHRQSDAGA